jgi:hypothetical protein
MYDYVTCRKDRYTDTKFCAAEGLSKLVASRKFKAARDITISGSEKVYYEVTMLKGSYEADVPKQIGATILNLAKLRMLDYYFMYLDKYFGM